MIIEIKMLQNTTGIFGKAIDIIGKESLIESGVYEVEKRRSKLGALICVDEILEVTQTLHGIF